MGPLPHDNITLNLNGHKVFGVAAGQGITQGIAGSGVKGVTVENGTVTGFDTGVYFELGSGETVTRMNVHDNIGSLDGNGIYGEGIQLFQVDRTTISKKRVVHNGPFAGIDIFDSSGTTISGNIVTDNNIFESKSHHMNAPNGIMQDIGIWVVSLTLPTTNNRILNNAATGNGSGRNSAAVAFDLADANHTPPCDSNVSSHNAFVTFNQPCATG